MGIQINGITDTISATDGGLAVSGQQLTGVTDINASGIVTATQGYVVGTGASVFSPAANTLALGTNGSERIRITSAGFMGLGTNNPESLFHINGDATALRITRGSSIGFAYNTGTSATDAFRIQSNGGSVDLYSAVSQPITFSAGGTEKARVDGSGRLLIGTSTARANFFNTNYSSTVQIEGAGTGINAPRLSIVSNTSSSVEGPIFILAKANGTTVGSTTVVSNNDFLGGIIFQGSDGTEFCSSASINAFVDGTPGVDDLPGRLVFSTTADGASSPTEQMRITQSGVVSLSGDPTGFYNQNPVKFGINKGSSSGECLVHIQGHSGNSAGANTYALRVSQNVDNANTNSAALRIDHTNPLGGTGGPLIQAFGNISNSTPQKLWEVFSYGQQMINRPASDGTLIEFQQAQTVEGSISVSGTTVSYNGAHLSRWSQLINIDPHDKSQRPEILRGTVMSNLDEMCQWIDPETGEEQDNEQLNKTQISTIEDDPNVAGVFQSWDDDDDTWVNDYYLAMTGDFVIRIAADTTVSRGDLLISAGDGTAKPQGDRYLKDSTIAKVTSTHVTCTYEDGSYCVPCVLMAC